MKTIAPATNRDWTMFGTAAIGSLTFFGRGAGSVRLRQRATPGRGGSRILIDCDARLSQRLAGAIAGTRAPPDYDHAPMDFEQHALHLLEAAAPGLVDALRYSVSQHPELIYVSGLPASDAPGPTPADGHIDQAMVRTELLCLIGAAAVMGLQGFAYHTENGGRMLRSVSPIKLLEQQASSQGAVDLQYHADNSDQRIPRSNDPNRGTRPMNAWQGFSCIRPCHGVPMRVIATADIVRYMHLRHWTDHLEVLMAPVFSIKSPPSHGGSVCSEHVPLLVETDDGKIASRYSASNVIAEDDAAHLALAAFASAIEACQGEIEVNGKAGTLLYYQNPLCLHRRQAYPAKFDGSDRWYVRVYFDEAHGLDEFRQAPDQRIF